MRLDICSVYKKWSVFGASTCLYKLTATSHCNPFAVRQHQVMTAIKAHGRSLSKSCPLKQQFKKKKKKSQATSTKQYGGMFNYCHTDLCISSSISSCHNEQSFHFKGHLSLESQVSGCLWTHYWISELLNRVGQNEFLTMSTKCEPLSPLILPSNCKANHRGWKC